MRFTLPLLFGLLATPVMAQAPSAELKDNLAAAAAARGRPALSEATTTVSVDPGRAATLLNAEAARLGWTSLPSASGTEQWSVVTDSGAVVVQVELEPASGGARLKPVGDDRSRTLAQKLFLLVRRAGLQ